MVDAIAAISAVVLLAVVTAATRVGGVWIMSYVAITPRIEAFLKYMSISVLISIVVATTWATGPRIWLGVGTAALMMVATRSAVSAMLAGTALAASREASDYEPVAIELCSSAQGSNSAIQQCLLDIRFASEGGRRLLRCGISIRLMTAQDHKQTFGDVLP